MSQRQATIRIALVALLSSLLLFFLVFISSSVSSQFTRARHDDKERPNDKKDRIHISEIQVLTFHKGRFTNARRTSPVPQLACVGGTADRAMFIPDTVQCKNIGSDGETIQWECVSEMPDNFKFGSIEVVCEGYERPGDEYVLKGSCQLEYQLNHVQVKQYSDKGGYQRDKDHRHHDNRNTTVSDWLSSFIGWLIVISIVVIICGGLFASCCGDSGINDPHWSSGTAVTTHADSRPSHSSFGFYPSAEESDEEFMPRPRSHSPERNDSRPGFWTGTAVGGAAGYAMG